MPDDRTARTGHRSWLALALVLALGLGMLAVGVRDAPGAFPGLNGAVVGGGCEPSNSSSCGLYIRDSAGVRRILDSGKTFAKDPLWAPDGARIAYVKNPAGAPGEFRLVNADGSGDRRILQDTANFALKIGSSSTDWGWTRGGTHLVYSSNGKIRLIDVADGSIDSEVDLFMMGGRIILEVAASPTTDRLAVVFSQQGADKKGIALVDPNGQNFQELKTLPYAGYENYSSISWAPDGARIAYAHRVLDASIGKGTSRVEWMAATPGTTAVPLTSYLQGDRDEGAAYVESIAWAPGGDWVTFKDVSGTTASWAAVRPDASQRLPLDAYGFAIDWQPCQAACPALAPGDPPVSTGGGGGVVPPPVIPPPVIPPPVTPPPVTPPPVTPPVSPPLVSPPPSLQAQTTMLLTPALLRSAIGSLSAIPPSQTGPALVGALLLKRNADQLTVEALVTSRLATSVAAGQPTLTRIGVFVKRNVKAGKLVGLRVPLSQAARARLASRPSTPITLRITLRVGAAKGVRTKQMTWKAPARKAA